MCSLNVKIGMKPLFIKLTVLTLARDRFDKQCIQFCQMSFCSNDVNIESERSLFSLNKIDFILL